MKFRVNGGERDIQFNMDIIDAAIRSVVKAVQDDVPRELTENNLETNNRLGALRGDWINQNLRAFISETEGEMVSFQRPFWHGRLLLDRDNRLSYSVTTESNLTNIPRKHRAKPHFLQSITRVENFDLKADVEQLTMYDMDVYDEDTYLRDFRSIYGGAINPADGFHHCVIAYKAYANEVTDIKLVLLDYNFTPVTEVSLNDYLRPDFSMLTSGKSEATEESIAHNEATRKLLSPKQGIVPKIKEKDKEA